MITQQEREFFLENGYLCAEGVLAGEHLACVQEEFERVCEESQGQRMSLNRLMQYSAFIELIEHLPILERHRAIFGDQLQLLQYDLQRQGPQSRSSERSWHRDFRFPGDTPLSINTLLFIDDMTLEKGPTRVLPGSHRGEAWPDRGSVNEPIKGEVAVTCPAGSAIFINGAIWHTGGRNGSEGLRRSIYLYYGITHFVGTRWLKRFDGMEGGVHDPPWQALEGASRQRLQLLGVKVPERYLEI
jgi:ectoine hydroxylase-related dioxygenase (phytanoyl-CoA dioxygenase family)